MTKIDSSKEQLVPLTLLLLACLLSACSSPFLMALFHCLHLACVSFGPASSRAGVPRGLLGDRHWICWTSGWGCAPGFGISEMTLRSLTNPGTTTHCPKVWKTGQPGSRPTAVGLCRLCLAHAFAVLTVSYFCWGWLKWKKKKPFAGHTRVCQGLYASNSGSRRELVPCPCCYAGGSQPPGATLDRTSQHHCWDLNLGSSYVPLRLTSHLRSRGGSTAKRRAARQEREGCRGKSACAAQHTAWAEWQVLWGFSNTHLALLPVLLLNLIPTSGYVIEKGGKTMRLEVGRRETTAPAQGSAKFRSIFKLQYLKKNNQNN